jgi:hypothetical protein
VTDHAPNPKKLHTNSEEEDLDFFNYEQKLKEFHADSQKMQYGEKKAFKHPAYESLMKAAVPVIYNGDFNFIIHSEEANFTLDQLKEKLDKEFAGEENNEEEGEEDEE